MFGALRACWLIVVPLGLACGPGKTTAPVIVKDPVVVAPEPKPPAPVADPTPPELRLPKTARPIKHDVGLTLDPSTEVFTGRIVIDLEILNPTTILWLNAEEITVDEASFISGATRIVARPIAQHKNFLGLVVDRTLDKGRATLTIKYRGKMTRNEMAS